MNRAVLGAMLPLFLGAAAAAQTVEGDFNPVAALEDAARAVPGYAGGLSTSLNILILLSVLTLAPAILVLCTCFTRIVIVLGLLRQALGTQSMPPGQVLVGLSLLITFVVMAPTVNRVYEEGVGPYARGEIKDYTEAWERSRQPLREFMFAQIEAGDSWSGVYMLLNYRGVDTSDPSRLTRADVDMLTLIPAFVLSELKVAFLVGFRIYLPFLVIDMVIASTLISMGMLMLPPVLISLPFKLLLFVLVDGWTLIVGALMNDIVQPAGAARLAAAALGAGPWRPRRSAGDPAVPQEAVDIARIAMTEALVIALPILASGLVVGLLVSLFQAVTQIQEQTLSFVPKIIVTALATMALLGWIALRLMDFATDMFTGY